MRWPAEALWEAVEPLLPGFTVEILPEVDSSNSELMRRARAGQPDPVLLVAERQTAGRGRLGRSWQSAPGDSLTFSLGLPLAPVDWSGLSLAVGASLAESLHPSVRLKWPNDLWVADRKLGGILIETASFGEAGGTRQAVIGVGINIAPRAAEGLSTPPAAVRELLPRADAGSVLEQVVPALVRDVLGFAQAGFAPFHARFDARDALRDREVTLSDGTAGTAHGVGEDGSLLVHTAAGLRAVGSSEVSVRPASR
ncbi:biotin--[acetyl-CoA-carboxylase] ligase [Ramlibacter sp. USB13]|uniref:biotin--[biotin carboxyl-carrier protein] ligase n=1 Tax=Ramlibacter cellulosilyticus TaxID=2764187 RepID=A0A923MPX6_9BURK|nr:biotin--[acetyl-CoA-carboxylase] ligase [Ramlibacter cellulosilyticus]MBC5782766.1 biotin--[acetyl-CoA-carboxylase] ligase [Ramlibacter cellulosilyticus]